MVVFNHQPATVLRFTGEDHLDFLQSQGTGDVRRPVGNCCHSLWLDFRGNIHGEAFLLRASESACLLVSYATPVTDLMEQFDRHIIADEVEMEDLTGQYGLTSVANADADEWLSRAGLTAPGDHCFQRLDKGFLFHGRRLGPGTLDLLYPVSEPLLQATVMTLEEAEVLRLRAGMPLFPRDADESTLNPVETNSLHSVSFEKGCYLGQEVVARVHRLQRLSKRLVLLESQGVFPAEGCSLNLDGRVVGKLTSVVKTNDRMLAIGWLKSKCTPGHHLFAEGAFEVRELPLN